MEIAKLQVFDPPMCCSSGVCGANVNPELVRFSSDLDWLKQQGVEVERYSLTSHPAEFVKREFVKEALQQQGSESLPYIVIHDQIVIRGRYPNREELTKMFGINAKNCGNNTEHSTGSATGSSACECGAGCNCGTEAINVKRNTIICLGVLLAIAVILLWGKLGFAAENPAPGAAKAVEQPKAPEPAKAADAAKEETKFGPVLETFDALDKLPNLPDVVFIYVPDLQGSTPDDKAISATAAAQKTLKSNNVTSATYTLPSTSADYPAISVKLKGASILVVCKGKGLSAVSGEVTEGKLLQAYLTTGKVGCGPAGCGGKKCN